MRRAELVDLFVERLAKLLSFRRAVSWLSRAWSLAALDSLFKRKDSGDIAYGNVEIDAECKV